MISKQGYLGFLASAYFLNVHNIRIAPTLSQPLTLRVEPSAYIENKDIDHFINALTMFCKAVEALDLKHLTSYLVDLPPTAVTENRGKCHPRRERPETTSRVAFLGNLATSELAAHFDPILGEFTDPELEAYLDRTSKFLGPTIFDQINIHSITGEATHLSFIGLNLTARQVMASLRENKTKWIIEKIDAALALARSEGCRVLGLGGHTSIITRNGLRLKPDGIVLTSGNSLTVGMGIQALKKAAQIKNIDIANSRIAIVGALGNIASVYAELMAPEVKEMVLIVRTLNSPGLEMLYQDIQAAAPKLKLSITDNLDALKDCPLIVSSTNSPDPLIYPTHLSDDPVVICDISMPGVVSESVRSDKPNALVIQGGLVSLPCNDDLTISGVPLQKGQVFACMAETLLMGFEGLNGHTSHGKLHSQNVKNLLNFAEKHGFRVGEIMPKENNGLQL